MSPPPSKPTINRRALIGVLGAGGAASSCSKHVGGYHFRIDFRLIVNGVLREVKTVRSVSWHTLSKWLLAGEGPFMEVHGSAVAIDLTPDRAIFLTLGRYYNWNGRRMSAYGEGERKWERAGPWTIDQLYLDRNVDVPTVNGLRTAVPDYDVTFHLAPHELPVLATFENPLRPGTGRVIRPENLTTEFPGVSFGHSTVRFSREGVTRSDIERRLPWLKEREPYKTGRRSLEHNLFRA